jgi:predicted DNA-binding transcriptional regulator AlpA
MKDELPLKMAVTVAEMARMVGLSRARFYQLMKQGVFPQPRMDESKKRPFYDQELQKACLEVRRRNQGVNGQVVLFYARRQEIAPTKAKVRKGVVVPKTEPHGELVEALRSLGLTTVTAAEVGQAVTELFGGRTSGKDEGEVIRAVFLHLKRRNTGDNVGR